MSTKVKSSGAVSSNLVKILLYSQLMTAGNDVHALFEQQSLQAFVWRDAGSYCPLAAMAAVSKMPRPLDIIGSRKLAAYAGHVDVIKYSCTIKYNSHNMHTQESHLVHDVASTQRSKLG
jgi:hypothetical protein